VKKFFKNKILQITSDWWETFRFEKPAYDTAFYDRHVIDILQCSDPQFGFTQYMCTSCGKDGKYVAFSCKSRLCLRCGRVSGEKFAKNLKSKLHPDIPYRHLVLTIPEQYRKYFYDSRLKSDLFNLFYQAGKECVEDFVSKVLGVEVESGCIIVLHTVGRNCRYNPHLHVLLMGGGVNVKTKEWVTLPMKFDYTILHHSWTKALMRNLYKWDALGLYREEMDEVLNKYKKFVCHIDDKEVPTKPDALISYLSRYISKPHMSASRILKYDPMTGMVEFRYNSHKTKRYEREKITAINFLGRLLQQILPKGFQKTRYYGLQAAKNKKRLNMIVAKSLGNFGLEDLEEEKRRDSIEDDEARAKTRITYADLCILWWGKDPFSCSYCGHKMELVRIWERCKGFTYSLFINVLGKDTGPPGAVPAFLH